MIVTEQNRTVMDNLFYIDTGGQEDSKDDSKEEAEKEEMVENRVMGAKDAATEAKLRNRAIKERSLASFLFGKTKTVTSDAESDHSDDGYDEERVDDDSDNDDPNTEEEQDDKSDHDDDSDNEDREGDSDNDNDDKVTVSSSQPTLPTDLFLANR